MSAKTGKKANQETRRSSLLLPVTAVFTITMAVAAYAFLSGDSEPGGSNSVQRPLVGGDFHALVVDPTNSEKAMVGGHEGAAVSYDGGATWRQISDLTASDPMGWVIDTKDPLKMYAGGHPGFFRSEDGGESWQAQN